MVGVTKIQRGNAGYWLAAVAEGGEDYYTKPGEAPGEWIGDLAGDLGLEGQVDAAGYGAILDGRDPITGRELLRRPPSKHRERPDGTLKRIDPVLGYDVRFSAPKSVSILYALGDEATRARVVEVMHAAVREGMRHLEAEACMVRRGNGGHRIERGEGFVGMAFRHRMSRAGDPALHVHVVVSNMTRSASDGKWLTIASPRGRNPLWPHAKSAGVVFQAALRRGLVRKLGLDFDPVTHGYADLADIDRGAIDALSTRSREIAGWMQDRGVEGPAAAQLAAYRTRDAKDYGVEEDARREEWIAAAEPHGLSPQSLAEMVAAGRPREPEPISDAMLDQAIARLEQTSSHFDRRALLWAVADQLPDGAALEDLIGAVDRILASDRIVCLHQAADPFDFDHFTTPRLAQLEHRFIDAALAGRGAEAAVVPSQLVHAVIERHTELDADQSHLVLQLTTGGERVVPIAAMPGTGKTTALQPAQEAWQSAGIPVIGCATARSASAELHDAGITPSTSIRSLLKETDRFRAEGKTPLPTGTVVVVDEATMTSTPDLEALRFLASECGGKLVVIGDPRQIGAVGPGGLYGHLTHVIEPARLETIHRQSDPQDRRLVELVHEGRGSDALDLLRTRNRLVVAEDLDSALAAQLSDWHRDYATGADAVMIARRNRDVDHLNESARATLQAEGAFGADEVLVGERPIAAGDRVLTRINSHGVANRERWEVVSVRPAGRTVELRRVGGDQRLVTLDPSYLDKRTDNGEPALEYAYALTKFGAQGKTVDRAYPLIDAGGSQEEELVALSRGREVANVYTVASSELVDADLGPGRRDVYDALQDVRDSIERSGNDFSAIEVAMRKEIATMTPTQLADRRYRLKDQATREDPLLSRRSRLLRQIGDASSWLERLRSEREAIEMMRNPPEDELRRVQAGEAAEGKRLRRCESELATLPDTEERQAKAMPADHQARLEAVLIDRKIDTLARLDIQAARHDPESVVVATLGPFPVEDPEKARDWAKGAHALTAYRRRHGITDLHNVLGGRPRDAATRAEQARAKREIAQAQRTLGTNKSHSIVREQDHRSIGITRERFR